MPIQQVNRNSQSEAINSRGFQFFNKDGFFPSTLILTLWNQNIVLKIHPAKEKSQQTDSSVFDYVHAVNLILPSVTATSLFEVCKRKVIPALNEGTEYTICIPCGATSGIVISTGVKRFGKLTPYISILKNIQPGNLQPEEVMSYEFNKTRVITGYDGTSNEGITQNFEYTELIYFIYALDRISMALIGAENHASRYQNRYFDKQVFGLYRTLGEKIGATFYPQNQRNTNYRKSSGGSVFANSDSYGNSSSNMQEPLAGEPVQVDSLADLDSFM